nr:hypothetical protein [Tanacetum cinerariifolium]
MAIYEVRYRHSGTSLGWSRKGKVSNRGNRLLYQMDEGALPRLRPAGGTERNNIYKGGQ